MYCFSCCSSLAILEYHVMILVIEQHRPKTLCHVLCYLACPCYALKKTCYKHMMERPHPR